MLKAFEQHAASLLLVNHTPQEIVSSSHFTPSITIPVQSCDTIIYVGIDNAHIAVESKNIDVWSVEPPYSHSSWGDSSQFSVATLSITSGETIILWNYRNEDRYIFTSGEVVADDKLLLKGSSQNYGYAFRLCDLNNHTYVDIGARGTKARLHICSTMILLVSEMSARVLNAQNRSTIRQNSLTNLDELYLNATYSKKTGNAALVVGYNKIQILPIVRVKTDAMHFVQNLKKITGDKDLSDITVVFRN